MENEQNQLRLNCNKTCSKVYFWLKLIICLLVSLFKNYILDLKNAWIKRDLKEGDPEEILTRNALESLAIES